MIELRAFPFILMLAVLGCRENGTQPDPGTVSMQIGEKRFTLEVAATESSRQRGLMYRTSLPEDRGMIFVFPEEGPRGFYMKNVGFPLDIIFLDEKGQVVSIRQMKPYDETNVPSGAAAKYAIELTSGAASAAGVEVGQTLRVPDNARQAADF